LPLIYTLNNCPSDIKRKVIHIVKNENTQKDKVAFVIDAVVQYGGIAYATEKMFAFRDDALAILHEFPASEVRDALEELVRYTTDRKY
jgi:octaprenyl-diphosphate synthase